VREAFLYVQIITLFDAIPKGKRNALFPELLWPAAYRIALIIGRIS